MDDELHPARLVEEAFEDHEILRRQRAERRARGGEIFDELLRPERADPDFLGKLPSDRIPGRIGAKLLFDLGAEAGDGERKRIRAARRLAEPEGDVGRLAFRVLDPDGPALDPLDAVGGVAELEHVARHALDGEILVDGPDDVIVGLEQHLVVGGVGNRPAGGQRRHSGAAPAAQDSVDGVTMDERAVSALARREAFRQHPHNRVEFPAHQLAERPGAPQAVEELGFRPVARGGLGDDLLRQHVERPLGNRQPVELAATDAVEQRRALDEIVPRQREQTPLGRSVDGVAGTAGPLQKRRDRPGRAELADQLDLADVDPELERCGRHHGFEFAPLQPLLGGKPAFLGHAAVMRGDRLLAETLREFAGDPLGHAAGVDEDERRAMALDQLRQAPVDLGPHFVGHHRLERGVRRLDAEVARPLVSGVDDRDVRRGRPVRSGARQKAGDGADRVLRRRESDAQQPVAAEGGEALERQGEVRAALVRREGMDLVDDDRAGRRQHLAAGLRAQEDVERFRRRHHDVRRPAMHARTLRRAGVAGSDPRADLDVGQAAATEFGPDARERRLEIAMDVVGQRFERRNIDDLGRFGERSFEALAYQVVERGKEGRQRFAGAGRGRDQGVAAGLDRGPGAGLGGGRAAESLCEPGRDRGVKQLPAAGVRSRAVILRSPRSGRLGALILRSPRSGRLEGLAAGEHPSRPFAFGERRLRMRTVEWGLQSRRPTWQLQALPYGHRCGNW